MFANEFDSDMRPICPLCRKSVTQDDLDRKDSCGAMSDKGVYIVHKTCFQTNPVIPGN